MFTGKTTFARLSNVILRAHYRSSQIGKSYRCDDARSTMRETTRKRLRSSGTFLIESWRYHQPSNAQREREGERKRIISPHLVRDVNRMFSTNIYVSTSTDERDWQKASDVVVDFSIRERRKEKEKEGRNESHIDARIDDDVRSPIVYSLLLVFNDSNISSGIDLGLKEEKIN